MQGNTTLYCRSEIRYAVVVDVFTRAGNYAEHLARWVDVFGEDKVLVVHMKDDQNSTIGALLDHFGQCTHDLAQ